MRDLKRGRWKGDEQNPPDVLCPAGRGNILGDLAGIVDVCRVAEPTPPGVTEMGAVLQENQDSREFGSLDEVVIEGGDVLETLGVVVVSEDGHWRKVDAPTRP